MTLLPTADRVVRYIRPKSIDVRGAINGSEFCLSLSRPDELGVSVNWLERFAGPKEAQLAEVRRLRRMEWKRRGCLAELHVGQTLEYVAEELGGLEELAGFDLTFESFPLEADGEFEPDPSHSEIRGMLGMAPEWNELVGDTIAQCVIGTHPASTKKP